MSHSDVAKEMLSGMMFLFAVSLMCLTLYLIINEPSCMASNDDVNAFIEKQLAEYKPEKDWLTIVTEAKQ